MATGANMSVKRRINYQEFTSSGKVLLYVHVWLLCDDGLGIQFPWDESLTSVQ